MYKYGSIQVAYNRWKEKRKGNQQQSNIKECDCCPADNGQLPCLDFHDL